MNNKERLELAGWAVEEARKSGANDASAVISKSRQVEIEHRNRQLDVLKDSIENSLKLAVYVNQRYSSYSTCDLRKDSLSRFIREAVAMTGYLNEDKYRSLPDPKYYEGREDRDLGIFDKSYESVASDSRVAIARETEETALAQSERVVACTSYYNDSSNEMAQVHSNGFAGTSKSTSYSIGLEVTVCDDKECRPNDYDLRKVRLIKDLPDHKELAVGAVERAFSKIGQKKIDSGRYDMIVENRAGTRLMYALYRPMQASSIQQKSSCLEDMIGKRIGSEALTIIDDPFIDSGLGSELFSSEGLAAKRRTIIDKGVLKSFYVDCYYGKKLGWEPTTGSLSNIVFEYGDKSVEQLMDKMQRGILVTGFIGGNSNSTTGDFSYGVTGYYIENGKIVHPINEMNISGNILEFWPKLIEVGNDPYIYSAWRRPSMYFKDIHFSGV